MRILTVGGGSGGHVTPVAAVCKQLKQRQPEVELRFWCDRRFRAQAEKTMASVDASIPIHVIAAGKLRRYYTLPLWKQLLRIRTIVLPNIIDGFKIAVGFVQSFVRLMVWRPDIIFFKGGFVCLPVGVAAHLLKIPFVLHDSDAHPGLTNRVLSRWAAVIGTGAPLEHYTYPAEKASYVGIPIDERFSPFDADMRRDAKRHLGIEPTKPLLVVTGGGLGSQTINDAIIAILDELLLSMNVVLISGSTQYEQLKPAASAHDASQFQLLPFVAGNMVEYLGAADLVIARAGATTLLELAALRKPTVLVPNPYLTGGHQLKNAAMYETRNAAVTVSETDVQHQPHVLLDTVNAVINNPAELTKLGDAIHEFARPSAAKDMAELILDNV